MKVPGSSVIHIVLIWFTGVALVMADRAVLPDMAEAHVSNLVTACATDTLEQEYGYFFREHGRRAWVECERASTPDGEPGDFAYCTWMDDGPTVVCDWSWSSCSCAPPGEAR